MENLEKTFTKILGPEGVIAGPDKVHWAKDYTKSFTPDPLLALFPKSTEEVSNILKVCNDNKIAVVPSGGRTGLCGGAVARKGEILLSTQRLNKILELNKLDKTIRVQSGVVTQAVQRAAEEASLFFPIDFASSGSSQIGGNIATNAGGIKVIRYGLMRSWVVGLKVVSADGSVLNLDNACIKNNTGYDLKQLFIGSEGTLGVITEALLRLTLPPAAPLVSLFAVPTLEKVTELFSLTQSLNLPLSAYEFFAESALKRVHEHTGLSSPFSESSPFYVLIEVEKLTPDEEKKLEGFVERALEMNLVTDGLLAQNSQQVKTFWGLRENISESISALTVAHKNDISLPISQITGFCAALEKLISKEYPGFEVLLFGHIGDGNLHVNFIKPEKMNRDDFFNHAHKADHRMFELVQKFGGSISAEHGIGLTKKDFLHYTRSPLELKVMKEIKKVLDPNGILNPGKLF